MREGRFVVAEEGADSFGLSRFQIYSKAAFWDGPYPALLYQDATGLAGLAASYDAVPFNWRVDASVLQDANCPTGQCIAVVRTDLQNTEGCAYPCRRLCLPVHDALASIEVPTWATSAQVYTDPRLAYISDSKSPSTFASGG